jgi:hypothetical protein
MNPEERKQARALVNQQEKGALGLQAPCDADALEREAWALSVQFRVRSQDVKDLGKQAKEGATLDAQRPTSAAVAVDLLFCSVAQNKRLHTTPFPVRQPIWWRR